MLDKTLIGRESEPTVVEVEKGAIRRFADALGDANPIHADEAAARAAGFAVAGGAADLPAVLSQNERFRHSLDLGTRSLLLGEESIEYGRPIVAGDRLTVKSKVADVQERAGTSGATDVLVLETEGRDSRGRVRLPRRARPSSSGAAREGDPVLLARQLYFEAVKVGDELPPLVKPPVDRSQIARFAGATGDYGPLHVDEPFARNAGFPSVLVPGMLAMGFLGELVTDWLRGARVRRFGARFVKIVWPGDVVTVRGRVVDRRFEAGGRYAVDIEVWGENQRGELVVRGAVTAQLYYSAEDETRQRNGQPPLVVTPAEEEERLRQALPQHRAGPPGRGYAPGGRAREGRRRAKRPAVGEGAPPRPRPRPAPKVRRRSRRPPKAGAEGPRRPKKAPGRGRPRRRSPRRRRPPPKKAPPKKPAPKKAARPAPKKKAGKRR